MQLNWVQDARVSRQLPGQIVVDIVERTPHAVLRKPGMLELIDATGHDLEPVSQAKAKGLLLISGPGAQSEVEALDTLLDAAPALRPQVARGRMDRQPALEPHLQERPGARPAEGGDDCAKALIDFARLDGVNRLIGGKVIAFDMRTPEPHLHALPASAPPRTSHLWAKGGRPDGDANRVSRASSAR